MPKTKGCKPEIVAPGYIYCEIHDEPGQPIPGFSMGECDRTLGDEIERIAL